MASPRGFESQNNQFHYTVEDNQRQQKTMIINRLYLKLNLKEIVFHGLLLSVRAPI